MHEPQTNQKKKEQNKKKRAVYPQHGCLSSAETGLVLQGNPLYLEENSIIDAGWSIFFYVKHASVITQIKAQINTPSKEWTNHRGYISCFICRLVFLVYQHFIIVNPFNRWGFFEEYLAPARMICGDYKFCWVCLESKILTTAG